MSAGKRNFRCAAGKEMNMNNNEQYLDTYASGEIQNYSAGGAQSVPAESARRSPGFFTRVLLWTFGIIVGATVLFGCLIFWVWGLDYLGVIDYDNSSASAKNEFNQDSGGYSEYDDFYDYFNDFFDGGNGYGNFVIPDDGGPGITNPQSGSPGIGVTIQEVPELAFVIDDKYTAGLAVAEINPKGALVGTEIQVGDLIVAANGEPCPNIDALDVQLKKTGVGGEMTLTVARYVAGVPSTFEVVITLIDLNDLN